MQVQEVHDQKQWNEFLLSQRSQAGVFLQSWQWGEFQKSVGRPAQISAPAPTRPDELQSGKSQKFQSGRHVYRYRAGDSFAQVIELPLPFGKKYWFIPRGSFIPGLEDEARKRGVLFIRVEPPVEMLQEVTGSYRKLQEVTPVHPKQTLIIDLTKSEDDLLAAMHEKTRYNVRLALRKGVELRTTNYELRTFEEFWKLMQETARRDKFRTHPRSYYETMLRICQNDLPPPLTPPRAGGEIAPPFTGAPPTKISSPFEGEVRRGLVPQNDEFFVQLHTAYHGVTPIAAAIVAYFGDTATYLHGASSYEHRALMGPYALHFEIMRDAKARGYKYYDLWGINTTNYELRTTNSWTGMTRFKMGFASPDVKVGASPDQGVGSGHIINYPGTFDLPLSKFWYTLYRLGRSIL